MNSAKKRMDNKLSGAHISSPDNRRRTPRQERSRITVEAILEAAGLLLLEEGYAGASTNAIAKRAGVSIGSLYQYFPNKERIFLALLERHHEEMRPIKAKAVGDLAEGRSANEVLDEVMRQSLAVRKRDPGLMTAMHRELAGLAAKNKFEGASESGGGADVLSLVLKARQDMAAGQTGERAWLVITILEAVGRRMVHEQLPSLDQETLISLTVAACRILMEGRAVQEVK